MVQNPPLKIIQEQTPAPTLNSEILFVDDSAMNLQVAKNLIQDLNLTAHARFFVNGQEIIDHVRKTLQSSQEPRPIGLMVLDMQMPIKNGLQVVQEVKAMYNGLKVRGQRADLQEPLIVFNTAFSSKGLRNYLKQINVQHCLDKPLSME